MLIILKNPLRGRSLYLFPASNPFRKFLHRIVFFSYFDTIVLFLIIISSILLAMDNPLNDPNGEMSQTLGTLNIIITALFTLECAIKIIVMGFVWNGRRSYMRNGWNILDFIIVLLSLASLGLGDSTGDLSKFKVLRTLRVLRPLRLISRN